MPDIETGEVPRLTHRLDKDTTGCLILARSKEAAAEIHNLFKSEKNLICRRYVAMVLPSLPIQHKPGYSQTIVTGITKFKAKNEERQRIVTWRKFEYSNI